MPNICIDPGHGGKDPGAVSVRQEKDLALQVSLQLRDLLTKAGFNVTMTRDKDESLGGNVNADLQRRCNIANNNPTDVFLSIHFNAGSSQAHGSEIYVFQDGGKIRPLAQKIVENVGSIMSYHGEPIKDGSGLYVIRNTVIPAMLLEIGFMDSDDIDKIIANLDKFAPLICKAFCDFYGMGGECVDLNIEAVQNVHDLISKLWFVAGEDHKKVLEYINDHLRKNFEGVK